jgi:Zn-finger nucleic acid-binding protein
VSFEEQLRKGRGEPLRCPNDGTRLVEIERAEVHIDACPECRGVWLDRGELDKILVRERQLAGGSDADEDFFREVEGRGKPAPRGGERYEDDRPRRRKRSFLEDLLDFD